MIAEEKTIEIKQKGKMRKDYKRIKYYLAWGGVGQWISTETK